MWKKVAIFSISFVVIGSSASPDGSHPAAQQFAGTA
jgi:hypothetical protein